jgi:hypothetical protein
MKMKRVMMMAAVVALMVAMFAPVALAVDRQCSDNPCIGTSKGDRLFERGGNGVTDNIYGKPGNDRLIATSFTNDRDNLYGGRGDDKLNATDGDALDTLDGGGGTDVCFGDTGDTYISCESINPPPPPPA